MPAPAEERGPQPPAPQAEGTGAAEGQRENAPPPCTLDVPEVARRYALSLDEARQCVAAFDDLLHLDRHPQGLARLEAIAAKAGAFLLDQFRCCTPDQAEARPQFITEALCRCLSPEVEHDLAKLLVERAIPLEMRGFAIVGLAHGTQEASRELLLDLFCEYMQRDRDQREPLRYRALVLAMESLQSPRAVPGLTRVIAEERRSASIELVLVAIRALGEIGDPRAIPPLRKLVKNRDRWPLHPQVCLALAHMKDDKAGTLARAARARQYNWTAWQIELFEEAERLCPPQEKDKKKSKDKDKDTRKEGPDAQ